MPTLYSRAPWRRARQIAGDLWLVGWTALWIWIAVQLHDLLMRLAAPGLAVAEQATDLAGSIESAGQSVQGLPLVGSALASPFAVLATASAEAWPASARERAPSASTAMFTSVALAILAFASFAMFWLPLRIAFARRAAITKRIVADGSGVDVLALRALVGQPLRALQQLGPDLAEGWRAGDQQVIRTLAELELRTVGVRIPAAVT